MTGEIVVGVSGASGTRIALRLIETVAKKPEVRVVHVVVSEGAVLVARTELDGSLRTPADLLARLPEEVCGKIHQHDDANLAASISSGSYPVDGMVVVPCSAASLAAIATGVGRGLLHRAADVSLKQRWPLVLAFRETPLSLVHAENIHKVTLAGAIVAPPVPPYYLAGATPEDWLDHTVERCLDLLGFEPGRPDLRWGVPRT